MTTPYNPPTRVKSLEVPFKTLIVRADPDFEQAKRREVFYEFSNGRVFRENNATQGPYAS
ncbi:hypothetical protein ABIB86_000444 [Bradyrhizobium sp. JR1.7]|uniref:hypothetical protein n=1 Tax=unclassified Bradyrhizobium TaxID=2631580 RepID=UPI003390907F